MAQKIMPRDEYRNAIPVARGFATQDAHLTPKTSPLTISDTEIAITVPSNAVALVYYVEDADIRISEVTGMARYTKILTGAGDTLECAETDFIYVKRDGTVDAKLQFYFKTL